MFQNNEKLFGETVNLNGFNSNEANRNAADKDEVSNFIGFFFHKSLDSFQESISLLDTLNELSKKTRLIDLKNSGVLPRKRKRAVDEVTVSGNRGILEENRWICRWTPICAQSSSWNLSIWCANRRSPKWSSKWANTRWVCAENSKAIIKHFRRMFCWMRSVMKESSWTYNSTNGTLRRNSFRGLSPFSSRWTGNDNMTVLTRLLTFFFFNFDTQIRPVSSNFQIPYPHLPPTLKNDSRLVDTGFYLQVLVWTICRHLKVVKRLEQSAVCLGLCDVLSHFPTFVYCLPLLKSLLACVIVSFPMNQWVDKSHEMDVAESIRDQPEIHSRELLRSPGSVHNPCPAVLSPARPIQLHSPPRAAPLQCISRLSRSSRSVEILPGKLCTRF